MKPERLDEMTLIPGVVETVARLSAAGFVCPGVWFASFAASLQVQGAVVVGPYVCPHRMADPCPCKKPSTLLYDRAASEHQLNPAACFVIGDSPVDVRAARRLGARGCLVRTGWAADPRVVEEAAPDASVVVTSLVEAAEWILHF